MIKALLFDFSRTLLFPKDKSYSSGLNSLYRDLKLNPNFNFLENFELNTELLDYLDTVKNKFGLYIYTSETIQEDPAIKPKLRRLFKQVFSAQSLNISKKDPMSYAFIAKELNLMPNEILFIDDSLENLEVAKSVGIKTLHYTDNTVIDTLQTL